MRRVWRGVKRLIRAVASVHPTTEAVFNRAVRRVERRSRNRVRTAVGDHYIQHSGANYALVASRSNPEAQKVGIFLKGACDVPSMFALAPAIRDEVRGTVCVFRSGIGAMDARSDILLQGIRGVPEEHTRELLERFPQFSRYFEPELFEPTFRLDLGRRQMEFPKSLVVLSVGPDLARSAYRHRRHGYVIDPGGAWLTQPLEKVLGDPEVAKWFRENFESIGRMPVEEFRVNFGEVVRQIKARLGAQLLVYNMLTVEPGSRVHNYRFVNAQYSTRRRAFHIALAEMSRELDFYIMDTDRLLKREGIREQVDFAHFSDERLLPIGREAGRILKDAGII